MSLRQPGVRELGDLDDVDLAEPDGPVAAANLQHNGTEWIGLRPQPFGGGAGGVGPGAAWTALAANTMTDGGIYGADGAGTKVYLAGGDDKGTDFGCYDLDGNTWTQLAALPEAPESDAGSKPYQPPIATFQDKVYFFGPTAAHVFSPDAGTWASRATAPPYAATVGIARAIGGKIYVLRVNKWSGDEELPTLTAYDPVSDSYTTIGAPHGNELEFADGCATQRRFLLIGGHRPSTSPSQVEVWGYDVLTGAWERLADLPEARNGTASGHVNGLVYVAGGMVDSSTDAADRRKNVLVYSEAANAWDTLASPGNDIPNDEYRRFCAGFQVAGRFGIVGGYEGFGFGQDRKDAWVYG